MNDYAVYRFIDEQEDVVYIGKATNLRKRILSHNHLPIHQYQRVRRIEYFNFENKVDMNLAERYYISQYKPEFNTVFKNNSVKNDKKLEEIFQNQFKTYWKIEDEVGGEKMNLTNLSVLLTALFLCKHLIQEKLFICLFSMFIGVYIGQNFIIVFKPKFNSTKSQKKETKPWKKEEEAPTNNSLEEAPPVENDDIVEQECKQGKDEPNIFIDEKHDDYLFHDEMTGEVLQELIDSNCKISASLIQRRFRVGYNRAARILEELESMGLVSEGDIYNRFIILEKAESIGFFKTTSDSDNIKSNNDFSFIDNKKA